MADGLDIEQPVALVAYLRQAGRIGANEEPAVRVLTGGVSNRTVLVERLSGEAWVIKQALTKLRVAVDWFSPPERIHREGLGMRWLARLAPPGATTPLIFEDHEHHLLAMAAVPQPHESWKALLLAGRIERDHVAQFARLLGTIHRRSAEARIEVEPVFADRGYFESLRLEPYYAYTATQVADATPFLERLIAETRARRDTLVHGDYSPKNVLVHEEQLILLDHEVIHWGDPGFDLGFSLTHFLSKAHHLPSARLAFADAAGQYWRTYRETVGDAAWANDLEPRAVRHTLGCLLARVAGRSPLEYLEATERARQRAAVLRVLMDDSVTTVAALIYRFLGEIERMEGDGTRCP
ncbi:MAG: phosphotransferase family protein [Thermomicrobiales bacterium]